MRETVFGVPLDTSWGDALAENLWFVVLLLVVAVLAIIGGRAAFRAAPAPDWRLTFAVDRHLDDRHRDDPSADDGFGSDVPLVSWYVFEKIVLMALITVIFSQVLPNLDATAIQVAIGVTVVVVATSAASQWISGWGYSRSTTVGEFLATLALNCVIVGVYLVVLRRSDRPVNEAALVFFVLLLTLIVTLFDRFHRRRLA